MSKNFQFNNSLLTIEKKNITLNLPTSEVHCISHNELAYLKEEIDEAFPVKHLEQEGQQLYLTWKIPDNFQSISVVYGASRKSKLLTAKHFLEMAAYFYNSVRYTIMFEPENIYVDQNQQVKVVFYTNKFHIPTEYNTDQEMMRAIKKMLCMLLTSMSEKEVEAAFAQADTAENNKNTNEIIEKIISAATLSELQQMADEEYRYYSTHNEIYLINQKNERKKKTLRWLTKVAGIIIIVVATYFTTRLIS